MVHSNWFRQMIHMAETTVLIELAVDGYGFWPVGYDSVVDNDDA